ncbi:pentatricopeptide repeat-containing protein At1g31430-like [Musa acuminata AAA Group]|uniref:pentatricopeptide repeat-containing protein At1g31430-like n=1 Tax=Musa acuminata AAA Group TaxID=214697 RepID=UPI0031D39B0D
MYVILPVYSSNPDRQLMVMPMSKSLARCLSLAKPCVPLLEACTQVAHLSQIHALVITKGLSQNRHASNAVLQICNELLRSHSRANSPGTVLLALYKQLLRCDAKPNGVTLSLVLKACPDLEALGLVMGVHAQSIAFGFRSDTLVLNSLIHAYTACGSVGFAHDVFDELPDRDQIAWTELINGYVRSGRAKEAVDLFSRMMEANVRPDGISIVAACTACSQLGDLSLGRILEGLACKRGVKDNTHVVNSLIDMYSKCGSIDDAWKLFDEMPHKDVVSWNSMVAGSARTGDMEAARSLFDQTPNKNEVSWSSLINGYVQNDRFEQALSTYKEMIDAGVATNEAAITGTVTACAHLGALHLGRQIHLSLDESKLCHDTVLSTVLVDMYAKCGCLDTARSLFARMVHKSQVSWNVMLMGLAIHGKAAECLELFSEMSKDGTRPSSTTFVAILSACAYAGWIEEGRDFFDKMTESYGITPRTEHLSCMVHLLGRAGHVPEACDLVRAASHIEPDVATWGALLSSCKSHGYAELADVVAGKMLELDPCHTGAYVQLSSMYASENKWREVVEIRRVMKGRGVKNRPGWSWFELDGTVHEFLVGVNWHRSMREIYGALHAIDLHINA